MMQQFQLTVGDKDSHGENIAGNSKSMSSYCRLLNSILLQYCGGILFIPPSWGHAGLIASYASSYFRYLSWAPVGDPQPPPRPRRVVYVPCLPKFAMCLFSYYGPCEKNTKYKLGWSDRCLERNQSHQPGVRGQPLTLKYNHLILFHCFMLKSCGDNSTNEHHAICGFKLQKKLVPELFENSCLLWLETGW